MGMQLDFGADQAVFDNTEVVTFTSVKTAGNETAEVDDAGFYPTSSAEGAPSYGVYTKGLARFSIRLAALEGIDGAKPRDTITRGNSEVYTVLRAIRGSISGVWQLDAVNLVLAADLRSTGTLSRPSNAQDTAGRPTLASYTAIATDIACRVQPEGGDATDVLGRRTIPKRFTAFLASTVDARAKDKFVSGGVTYTVLAARQPERIDELMTLTLEQVL